MRALSKAIRSDPNLAEAYMSLGMLHWGQVHLSTSTAMRVSGTGVVVGS